MDGNSGTTAALRRCGRRQLEQTSDSRMYLRWRMANRMNFILSHAIGDLNSVFCAINIEKWAKHGYGMGMNEKYGGSPPAARPSSSLMSWLRLAAHPKTVKRAFITAVIVGTVLIAINHGAAILAGQVTHARCFQMCLTVLVPYIVSTVSSVSTRRELGAGGNQSQAVPQKGQSN
jgi:hypothetical protein